MEAMGQDDEVESNPGAGPLCHADDDNDIEDLVKTVISLGNEAKVNSGSNSAWQILDTC